MKNVIVIDGGNGMYIIFNRDEFNDNGYLSEYDGVDGYHIDDFDIVAEFNTLEEAIKFTESHE